nr:hypothetical protein [Vibrio kanaloae]
MHAAFLPENKQVPFNLGFELMNAGIETVIRLEGKEYRVNGKS